MLTDVALRRAKPGERPRKLYDSDGLYLLLAPAGGKWWRFKYRFGGKEKLLSLGTYPEVPLSDARSRRDEARRLVASGVDPSAQRKAAAASSSGEGSFEVVAREWHSRHMMGKSENHARKMMRLMVKDIFPWLGPRPVAEVSAPEALDVLRRVEGRGANELAHQVRIVMGQVFRYAIATGRAVADPTSALRGALSPVVVRHHAALVEPSDLAALLRAIDGYTGLFVTACALKISPLVLLRPGEVRHAEWSEIDLGVAEWRIPARKMKMRSDHVVPLARQAVTIFEEIRPLTGGGRYIFPCARAATGSRPMSENAINAALRRMGFSKDEMTAHGFRATARTILDEVLGFRPDYIEHQLAHAVRDPNGRAYNRTAHLPERRKMMQAWADYLDGLRDGRPASLRGPAPA